MSAVRRTNSLRWGSEAPEDPEAARQRLVDAAEECFKKFGVMKTTVEDVAAAAHISRATVYRYFTGRDELILAVLMRDSARFLDDLRQHVAAQPSLADGIVEGVLYTLSAVRRDPNLALLFTGEAAGVTGSIAGSSEALFEANARFITRVLGDAHGSGQLRPDLDLDEIAEWILRVVLSLLSVTGPVERNEESLRHFLHRFLVPSLVATVDEAPPGVSPEDPGQRRSRRRFARRA